MSQKNNKLHPTTRGSYRSVHSPHTGIKKTQKQKDQTPVLSATTGVSTKTIPCSTCGKLFSKNAELFQHRRDKHETKTMGRSKSTDSSSLNNKLCAKTFGCHLCVKQFLAADELSQHKRDKHHVLESTTSHAKTLIQTTYKVMEFRCSKCTNTFGTEAAMLQHKMDKHLPIKTPSMKNTTSKGVVCSKCDRRFSTREHLSQHNTDTHEHKHGSKNEKQRNDTKKYQCSTCSVHFVSSNQLSQHQKDKHLSNQQIQNKRCPVPKASEHILINKRTRSLSLDAIVGTATRTSLRETAESTNKKRKMHDANKGIDKAGKKDAVRIVDDLLSKIMSHVKLQEGGSIYCPNHVKAGSYPVNTKIGKPDEFDTNICLQLEQEDVNVNSKETIYYEYQQNEHLTNMNVQCKLGKTVIGHLVPEGYAVASVTCGKIYDRLKHGMHLIPREVIYDLYQRIKRAISEMNLNHVDLSRISHGPALTITIHPRKHPTIQHDISVDITLSLPCHKPIHNWPRRETNMAFSKELIDDVKAKGTHLVPKKDEFWLISYSKAETELFSKIDDGNGCRKLVFKNLKKYKKNCESRTSLPGLSSHILKTQLLWSCEKRTMSGYWHQNNQNQCLIDVMYDLELTLRKKQLPDYFNTKMDILIDKDRVACLKFADYIGDERRKLGSNRCHNCLNLKCKK